MNRREAISSLSFAGGASLFAPTSLLADVLTPKCDSSYAQAVAGTATGKNRDMKKILTTPKGMRFGIVKSEKKGATLRRWGGAGLSQGERERPPLESPPGFNSDSVLC